MATQPRFLLDQELTIPGEFALDTQESHHAANVLRLRPGDGVIVFDGKGNYGPAQIAAVAKGVVSVRVETVLREKLRPVRISIATGIPKGKRWQVLVEKCTELGVDRLVPMLSGRSVVRGEGDPGRWRRWAAEAAKQSRRAFLPEILEPISLAEVLEYARREGLLALLADQNGESPRTYQAEIKAKGSVMVLIGPEGGFTDEEVKLYEQEGVVKICLSPFVLRIETAAATACALIQDL